MVKKMHNQTAIATPFLMFSSEDRLEIMNLKTNKIKNNNNNNNNEPCHISPGYSPSSPGNLQ